MKEFIDKLISRLEEEIKGFIEDMADGDYLRGNVNFAVVAKDIVNELAEEYINTSTEHINCSTDTSTKVSEMPTGWIPCERELPEADHYVLCQGNHSMFVACVDSFDGEWRDNHFYKRTTVKAWCELPAPYTEGE